MVRTLAAPLLLLLLLLLMGEIPHRTASQPLRTTFQRNDRQSALESQQLTKPQFAQHLPRLLQQVDSNNNSNVTSYQKCFSILNNTQGALPNLSQDAYLQFLANLTEANVPNQFRDLPAVYVMLFHALACPTPDRCGPNVTPFIDLGTSLPDSEAMQFFCKVHLKSASSVTMANFEYTIRYDAARIESLPGLANCLTIATVNVLLEQVADCPLWTDIVGPRTADAARLLRDVAAVTVAENDDNHRDRRRRRLQDLGSAAAPAGENCRYSVSSTVSTITELACGDTIDVDNDTEGDACGLVQQSVTLQAPQLVEPFEALLRVQVVSVLRDVINSGNFVNYFPPDGCFL